MKASRIIPRVLLLILVFGLLTALPALADHEMWVEFYYEFSVAEADPGKEIGEYHLFEGDCKGLDFYITGDGKSLMLYGAPLIPGDYHYDIMYVHTDGTPAYTDFWIYCYPTEVPETEPTPAPAITPTPDVSITKHPTGETVDPGGSAVFIARADYDSEILWRLISPAGEVYEAQYADNELDGLGVSGLGTETLTLSNIPQSMSGWSVECEFIGINGSSAVTSRAKVTVNVPATAKPTAAPTATPAPTEEPEPTEEPAPAAAANPTEEPRPTREPKPQETPIPPVISEDTPTAAGEKGGKGTAGDEKTDGGIDFRLVAAIALGVIGVGLVAVLVLMLVRRKAEGSGKNPSAPSAGAASPYSFRCDKCGWKPADPGSIPRFCPNCGDVFDEKDVAVVSRDRNGIQ